MIRALECSLVLIARMVRLHSYGCLMLMTTCIARRNLYFSTIACYHFAISDRWEWFLTGVVA